MKTTLKLLALLIFVTISSCDNSKKIEYKYAESPKLLACEFPNGDLLKEAVYSFQNDIINNYDPKTRNEYKALSTFITKRNRGQISVNDIASEHSLKIAHALKEDKTLWSTKNNVTTISNSKALMDCIVNNIKSDHIRTTYNALLATNSLEPRLILPLLNGSTRIIQVDGSVKTYVALEFFYAPLLNSKLEQLANPNPKEQPEPAKPAINGVNLNQPNSTLKAAEKKDDAHAGHNH